MIKCLFHLKKTYLNWVKLRKYICCEEEISINKSINIGKFLNFSFYIMQSRTVKRNNDIQNLRQKRKCWGACCWHILAEVRFLRHSAVFSVSIIMQFSFSQEGDLFRLRQLYDKDEDIIHQVFGKQRKTLLHLSVENKRIDMVSYILENGKEEDSAIIISITIL